MPFSVKKTIYLVLQMDVPYYVKLRVTNNARLSILEISSPILYDNSSPSAGRVVDGRDFANDVVWFGSTSTVTGIVSWLHLNVWPGSHKFASGRLTTVVKSFGSYVPWHCLKFNIYFKGVFTSFDLYEINIYQLC